MWVKHKDHFILDGVEVKECVTCGRFLPVTSDYFNKDSAKWDGVSYRCRECAGSHFVSDIPKTTKVCNKCGRELELSPQYFHRCTKIRDGYNGICRECRGSKFAPIPKEGFKFCSKCGKELPNTLEYFMKSKGKSGIGTTCRNCSLEYKRRYNAENREWINEKNRQYNLTHKEEISVYGREYRKTHPHKPKPQTEESRERKRNYVKIYDQTHKEEMRIKCNRRRAKKRQLPSTLTKKQWLEIKEYFGNKCVYCGKELPLQQEHFIPLSKGGEYTHNNIVCACAECNYSKGDKDFFLWYPKQPFYNSKREQTLLKFLGYKGKTQQLALM